VTESRPLPNDRAMRRARAKLEADLGRRGLWLIPVDPATPVATLDQWRQLATTDQAQIKAWGEEGAFADGFGVMDADGNVIGIVIADPCDRVA
jgi:bifunctional DNA primase/polymerase-like protein